MLRMHRQPARKCITRDTIRISLDSGTMAAYIEQRRDRTVAISGKKPTVADLRHAKAIERLLNERRWSLRQLSVAAGLDRTSLHRILSGENAGIKSLQRVADAFGVDISELFPPPPPVAVNAPKPDPTKKDSLAEMMKAMMALMSERHGE